MSDEAAEDSGYDVVTSKHRWTGNGREMIVGDTEALVKVIAEKQEDGIGGRIIGARLCSPWATEQLGQGYLAVNSEATVDEVAHFIQPRPTLSAFVWQVGAGDDGAGSTCSNDLVGLM